MLETAELLLLSPTLMDSLLVELHSNLNLEQLSKLSASITHLFLKPSEYQK